MASFFESAKTFLTKESTISFVKNVAKTAVTMGIIGLLLGTAAPILGAALFNLGLISAGIAETAAATSPAWTGAFFATFGGLQATVAPLVSKLFDPPKPGVTLLVAQASGAEQAISAPAHAPAHAAVHAPSAATAQATSPTHFQDMIVLSKATITQGVGGKGLA